MVATKSAAQLEDEIAEYLARKPAQSGKTRRASRAQGATRALRTPLPRYDERKGAWRGGDGRTLYAFIGHLTGHMVVRPGGQVTNMGPEVTVRVATRDEAERLWQNPLHVGWRVA